MKILASFSSGKDVMFLDVQVGDVLEMRKAHPCGSKTWSVLRIGMDFKLKCAGCDHVVMIPRSKAEKNIKNIIRNGVGVL